nr:hypothetical protein [Sporomusa silvacetica]
MAVSTALTFIIPTGAIAASVTTSTTAIRVGDASFYKSETYSDSMRLAHALSSYYDRPILTSEVVRLTANFDFGFGDISMMYAVADYAGLPIDDIVVLRKKHMGWGEIAKLHGLKVQELKHRYNLFVDEAHFYKIAINYIDEYDNYPEHDRDNDRNHDERYEGREPNRNHDEYYEQGQNPDRSDDERYEHKHDQNSNKDKQQDKDDKKDNKKVLEHNNDKGNGHK